MLQALTERTCNQEGHREQGEGPAHGDSLAAKLAATGGGAASLRPRAAHAAGAANGGGSVAGGAAYPANFAQLLVIPCIAFFE